MNNLIKTSDGKLIKCAPSCITCTGFTTLDALPMGHDETISDMSIAPQYYGRLVKITNGSEVGTYWVESDNTFTLQGVISSVKADAVYIVEDSGLSPRYAGQYYYTINPYASSIAIPANTATISISCNSGTSYITYGTSGTAAVSKSFTSTAVTGIPAGTTEYSRCMHLNNNSTGSKTYTVKCLNSSGSLLATRTFSVNYRHNTLVFSSTSASSARTMYVQILLD